MRGPLFYKHYLMEHKQQIVIAGVTFVVVTGVILERRRVGQAVALGYETGWDAGWNDAWPSAANEAFGHGVHRGFQLVKDSFANHNVSIAFLKDEVPGWVD